MYVRYLTIVLSFLVVTPLAMAKNINVEWEIIEEWTNLTEVYVFEAQSTKISSLCKSNPDGQIVFPVVQQSVQEIYIESTLIHVHGNANKKILRSYYGAPILSCSRFLNSDAVVTWKVYAYAATFAKLQHLPEFSSSPVFTNVINEAINVIVAGFLPFMALTTFVLFYRAVPINLNISLSLSSLFHGIFFITTVQSFFNIELPVLITQKIGDIALWLGVVSFLNCLRVYGIVPKSLFWLFAMISSVSCVVILMSNNLDTAQLGTSVPFGAIILILLLALFREIMSDIRDQLTLYSICVKLSLGAYVAAVIHDILSVEGHLSGYVYMYYAIGVTAGLLFFALLVHLKILKVYRDRDYLRSHLEDEVARKTEDLSTALDQLHSTQAELIQSAKLASLGTLLAGIAHEINNAINYIHGSIYPLSNLIKREGSEKLNERSEPLLKAMKEGTRVVISIIKSLKQSTSSSDTTTEIVDMDMMIKEVTTMLCDKFRGQNVDCILDIPKNMNVQVNRIILHQTLSNLIINAIDSVEKRDGVVTISAERLPAAFRLSVKDNGCGMSEETLSQVFDPFYTTKEVGKGTGLGLYIVRNELLRIGGEISIQSVLGSGTIVEVTIPS